MESLPTFWTQEELLLLGGTTLAPAMGAKLKSLRAEYDRLRSAAERTRWYMTVKDHLDLDDWLQVDAMYRSRALDFPNIGHCMAPCIDLANHASNDATVAIYEKDTEGNAILLLRDNKRLKVGDEVTITYGDEKGACEMIFSYGFLEHEMESAETVFLSLDLTSNDQMRIAKASIADCAPGVKIVDAGGGKIEWTGDFIWLLCVNAEDGLRFELARTVDGQDDEMQAFFGQEEITGGAAQLHELLKSSPLWDVYHLRAMTLLQQRVFDQLQGLFQSQDEVDATHHGDGTEIKTTTYALAMKLRQLEFELLELAYESFEEEVCVM